MKIIDNMITKTVHIDDINDGDVFKCERESELFYMKMEECSNFNREALNAVTLNDGTAVYVDSYHPIYPINCELIIKGGKQNV